MFLFRGVVSITSYMRMFTHVYVYIYMRTCIFWPHGIVHQRWVIVRTFVCRFVGVLFPSRLICECSLHVYVYIYLCVYLYNNYCWAGLASRMSFSSIFTSIESSIFPREY